MNQANLFDICNPKQWKTISSSKLIDKGYSVYGANGIIGYYSEYNHSEPTLMITCRGATCGTLNISEPRSYITGNAMALDHLSDNINMKYLYYFLRNRGFKDVISGSAQPQITREGLSKIMVPIIPIEEQTSISNFLDQADSIREKRKQAIDLLDEYLKSVFLEMFGDPYLNPKKWSKEELCNLVSQNCPLTYGIVQPGDDYTNGTFVVRPVDLVKDIVTNKSLKRIDPKIANKYKRTMLKGGELLLSVRGTTGIISIADEHLAGANVTRGITPIWFSDNYDSMFAFYLFKSNAVQKEIQDKTYGIALKQINLSDLRQIKLINPPLELQKKFAKVVENTLTLERKMEDQSIELDNQFNALMQKSFEVN